MQPAKSPQTERVTFLTSRDQKAALDAFAASRGESVGNVVREATMRYMAQPREVSDDEEAALNLLVDEIEASVPKWHAKFDSMESSIAHARKAIRDALAVVETTK